MSEKRPFRSYYDHIRFYSNIGSPYTDDYEYKTDSKGTKYLALTGHTNLDEKIQSWADVANLKKMIARFNMGDVNALNAVQGMYGDFKDMPTTYAELYARLNECDNAFKKLAPEVRAAFDNDPAAFWSQYGTPEFNEKIDNIYLPHDVLDAEINTLKGDVVDGE